MRFSSNLLLLSMCFAPTLIAAPATPLHIYNIAAENDPTLLAEQAVFFASKEDSAHSKGGLYPEVDLTAEIARNREDVEFTSGTGSQGLFHFDSNNVQLRVKQALYDKDTFSSIDIADAEYQAAENDFKQAQQDIIMRVMESYFAILSAQDNLGFAKAEKDAIDKQLQNIKRRYKVGKSSKTDLQEAQASYDLSFAQVIIAQDNLDDALEGLTQLTGESFTEITPLASSFTPVGLRPTGIDYWIKQADTNNLQLSATRHSIRALRYKIEQQQAGHYPTLDLVAKYRVEETGGRFGESETDDGSIGLELSMPLYKGGKVNSKVRSANIRLEEARHRMLKTHRSVMRETRKSYRAIMTSLKRIDALKQAVSSANTALSSITKGYKVGTRTSADVLDSQRELFKAQRDYSADRYNYVINYLQLKNIIGSLDKDDLLKINQWFR